jgi:hypothetical protein
MNEELTMFLKKMNTENNPVKTDKVDLKQLQEEILKLQTQLSEMPKNVIQEKRFLFFPEHHAKEYYSTMLRWLLYMLIATYAFCLLKFLIEKLQ